jgi:hypothetical protein
MVKAQTNTYPLTGSAGLGTTTPTASALLDMTSTSQGLLAPRMTKAQRDAIASPATGLLISKPIPHLVSITIQERHGMQFPLKVLTQVYPIWLQVEQQLM